MQKLLSPAHRLLDRLKYPQKFALISMLFVLPLGLVMALLFAELGTQVAFSQKELAGTLYLRPLRSILEHLPQAQLWSIAVANGDAAARDTLLAEQAQIDQAFAELAAQEQRNGAALNTATLYAELDAMWQQLKREQIELNPVSTAPAHDRLFAAARQLMRHVGDTSNLILDPDLESYYLMDAVLLKLPEGQDLLTQVLLIDQQQRVDTLSQYQRAQLFQRLTLLDANYQATQEGLDVAASQTVGKDTDKPLNAPLMRLETAVGEFRAAANGLITGATVDQQAIGLKGQAALTANFELWDRAVVDLERLLQARIAGLVQKQVGVAAFAILALLSVSYLLIAFYTSVMRTVSSLETAADRLIKGDPHDTVVLHTRDELGQVARSFNAIATALITSSAHRQAVVENAQDSILTLDATGTILSCNPASERLFGYAAVEMIGKPVTLLIAAFDGQQATCEGVAQHQDRTNFPVDISLSPMRVGVERLMLCVLRDITERKQAEAERTQLQEAIIRAQAAALEELATPLIPISDQTVVMPLIGAIDTRRAQQMVAALLHGVEAQRASIAILDITGVPIIDTQVAHSIIQAAQAVRLLGAQVVLTGIRPEVAQTLVSLGVDLRQIATHSSLESGIAYAFAAITTGVRSQSPHFNRSA